MPRVSVIITAYNHRQYILDALDSVFAQSYKDIEVIVVDDGSIDDTAIILERHIKNCDIRYIFQENQGVAAARNRGASLAHGEYLAFLDDDDKWPEDKLEWQVAVMDAANTVVVGGAHDRDRHILLNRSAGVNDYRTLPTNAFFKSNPFGSPGQTLIRRTAFETVGGFDKEIWGVDDLDIWIRLSRIGEVRKYSKLALFYRVHTSNASHNHDRMALNLKKVICKNSYIEGRENVRKLDRLGHRYLFNYSGKKMLWRAGASLFSGDFKKALSIYLDAIKFYKGRFLKDPILFGMLTIAFIKIPFKAHRYL